MFNKKRSSQPLASLAAQTMQDKRASAIKKLLAASVVSQARTGKQTGAKMESIASRVLGSSKYSEITKSLAASLLSQANKPRTSRHDKISKRR